MGVLDRFRLDGRVVVVTGAGKGIGAAIAVSCAEAGADVVLAARTREDLDRVAGIVRALGRRALEDGFADADRIRRHLDELVLVDPVEGGLDRLLARWDQNDVFRLDPRPECW